MLFNYLTILFLGFLSAYAQRPTDGTIAIRQDWGQIPQDIGEYDVLLSVPNCDLIGHSGVMIVDDQEFNALVFDCAGEFGHWWMLTNDIAAEVDYYFWINNSHLIGSETSVTIHIEESCCG